MKPQEQERKLRDDVWRGQQAEIVLKSPLIVEYFDETRRGIMEQLGSSTLSDDTEKDLILFLKAVNHFERDFKKKIQKGHKATSLIEKLFRRK